MPRLAIFHSLILDERPKGAGQLGWTGTHSQEKNFPLASQAKQKRGIIGRKFRLTSRKSDPGQQGTCHESGTKSDTH